MTFQSWKTATSRQTYIPGISWIIIHLHTCPHVCGARHSWSSNEGPHRSPCFCFFQTTSDLLFIVWAQSKVNSSDDPVGIQSPYVTQSFGNKTKYNQVDFCRNQRGFDEGFKETEQDNWTISCSPAFTGSNQTSDHIILYELNDPVPHSRCFTHQNQTIFRLEDCQEETGRAGEQKGCLYRNMCWFYFTVFPSRDTFNMSLSLLLLLLLVGGAQASHFYGTVMTYYPKNTNADGSLSVRTASIQNHLISLLQTDTASSICWWAVYVNICSFYLLFILFILFLLLFLLMFFVFSTFILMQISPFWVKVSSYPTLFHLFHFCFYIFWCLNDK